MRFSVLAASACTLASVAYAQSLSSQCTLQLGLLAVGDLGTCLALEELLPLVSNTSTEVVDELDDYLEELCEANRTQCSNATLTSAKASVESGCASDISSSGSSASLLSVLNSVFDSYSEFYTAACSRNESTNQYCVISILEAVQNATNQSITADYLTSLLGGSTSSLASLNTALDNGQLCTDCVAGIYRQAIAANASVTDIPAVSSIASRCGSGFGTTTSETGVLTSSLPSGSGSSSSGAASSSAAASSSTPNSAGLIVADLRLSGPALLAVMGVVGGVIAGGAAVL